MGFLFYYLWCFKRNVLKFTFNKNEKLKSTKLIDQLFIEGQSVSVYPLRMVYLPTTFDSEVLFKTGVSVSKRNFKSAVDRNYIKRLLREAYRLNKPLFFNNITTPYAFMILYIGKDKPTFVQVEMKMKQLFKKILDKVSE